MVREAHLDPTNLRWPNFIIAELDGQVVGIGQVRPSRGSPELGSLVVDPALRRQGIAAAIIKRLIADHPGDLYLECAARLVPFYRQFGFERIPWQQAPFPLKLKAGLGSTLGRLLGFRIAVMKRRESTL